MQIIGEKNTEKSQRQITNLVERGEGAGGGGEGGKYKWVNVADCGGQLCGLGDSAPRHISKTKHWSNKRQAALDRSVKDLQLSQKKSGQVNIEVIRDHKKYCNLYNF